jgi:hypothetical protein
VFVLDGDWVLVAQSSAMILRTVMLQPLGGSVAGDPAAPNPAPTETPPAPSTDSDAGTGVIVDPGPATTLMGASQELCEKANSEANLATVGYGVGAGLIALFLFVLLEKKHFWSPTGRYGFSVFVGSALAATLAFVDPARGDQFKLCLNDPVNTVYLTLGTQPVARALVLGLTPALLLSIVLCFLAKRFVR